MQNLGLFICTTCFHLTSLGQGMQRCRCEGYVAVPGIDCPSGYVLCYICATSIAGGTTRYSWNVCQNCLKFNRWLAKNYGGSIPVGRHSIMNSISIPMKATSEEEADGIEALVNFLMGTRALEDWADLQARELFESVLSWQDVHFVPIDQWEKKFRLSKVKATERSAQCFKDYLRITDFEEIKR